MAKTILRGIAPGEDVVKSEIVREFLNHILSVPVQDQVDAYKLLGNELNKVLYEQTIGGPNIQQIDLQSIYLCAPLAHLGTQSAQPKLNNTIQ